MNRILTVAAMVLALLAVPLVTTPARAAETYDLLFRNGTLDDISRGKVLIYERSVTNSLKPDSAERDTGDVELGFDGGTPERARLRFLQDDKHRGLGSFPASVGNPIIMYFVETVVRDMAESAGGSPFYIRNRVKEALVAPAEVRSGEIVIDGKSVAAQTVTLRPFRDDPNADRMQGFGELALIVTMSEAVPGWYHTLEAQVPGQAEEAEIYSSVLVFKDLGESQ